MSQKFFTRKFFLDSPIDRYTNRGGDHYIGPFTSFWVSNTNNSKFQADIVINPREDRSKGLPLRLNQCQSIEGKANEACIEFSTAQAGTWIEITFSQDDRISVGSVVVDSSGKSSISEGSNHSSSKKTVSTVTAELLPAKDNRAVATLQYKSGGSIWIGNPTELSDPDYKNICTEINSSNSPFEWRNSGALFAKTDAGTVIFSCMEEVV